MRHGDFTELAENYAKYRPGYAKFVLDAVMGLLPANPLAADVGAGTGIWSRMLAARGARVIAVEPNDAMRVEGMRLSPPGISWLRGSAEDTALPGGYCDLISMASSFHWTDFDRAVVEFKRVLKPSGVFAALWNTRCYESNPLLSRIEDKLRELAPNLKRISSGRSAFCDGLTRRLGECGLFADVLYAEAFHGERQTPDHYLGIWKSVNDVRTQAGEERFAELLDYIRDQTRGISHIEVEYKTRAWIARVKGCE
jgi:ubiquinone/menaquinone biosynthesis C-methylase UbiE